MRHVPPVPARGRPPDVSGYPLEEARRILAAAGWTPADIAETRPPRRTLTGPLRVVRQRAEPSGRIALVVCGEHVEDGAAPAPGACPGTLP